MPDAGCRMPDAGCWMPDARPQMQDDRMQDAGYWVLTSYILTPEFVDSQLKSRPGYSRDGNEDEVRWQALIYAE